MSDEKKSRSKGVGFGALGVGGAVALQETVDQILNPQTYADIDQLKVKVQPDEFMVAIIGEVPHLFVRNRKGDLYKLEFTKV